MEKIARKSKLHPRLIRHPFLTLAVVCVLPPSSSPTIFAQQNEIKKQEINVFVPNVQIRRAGAIQPAMLIGPNELRVYMSLRSQSGGRSRLSVAITGGVHRNRADPIETLKKEIDGEIDRAIQNSEQSLKNLTKKQIDSLRAAARCDAKYFLREVTATLGSPDFTKGHQQNELGQIIFKASQELNGLDKKYQTLFTGSTGLYQRVLTKLRRQLRPQMEADATASGAVGLFLLDVELESGLEAETILKVRKWLESKSRHKTYGTVGRIANLVLTTFDDPSSVRISASEDTRLRAYCKRLIAKLPLDEEEK